MVEDVDRASLAQQLVDNPLYGEIMSKLERDALEICANVHISDEERFRAALKVQTIRDFRAECDVIIRNSRPRKVATV